MTTMHPYQALMTAVFNRLVGAGIWGDQVSEVVQPSWTKPYCQVYFISGMQPRNIRTQDAQFEIGVKVIAETQQHSLTGAARLLELLNDQGEQDQPTTTLYGGADWQISTVSHTRLIHAVENFANATPIYHDGGVYQIVMGRRAS